mmetsp:Transcript_56816/g.90516  ORF Transcript_56816/g.90516 Transcript_56816/m.90516 type:complete len:240 (-) Transcript_56816:468-1187(-)
MLAILDKTKSLFRHNLRLHNLGELELKHILIFLWLRLQRFSEPSRCRMEYLPEFIAFHKFRNVADTQSSLRNVIVWILQLCLLLFPRFNASIQLNFVHSSHLILVQHHTHFRQIQIPFICLFRRIQLPRFKLIDRNIDGQRSSIQRNRFFAVMVQYRIHCRFGIKLNKTRTAHISGDFVMHHLHRDDMPKCSEFMPNITLCGIERQITNKHGSTFIRVARVKPKFLLFSMAGNRLRCRF